MAVTKEACPACREEGHDRSGDNLQRWPEGNAYCVRCGYKEHKGGGMQESKGFQAKPAKLTTEQVSTYPLGADPARSVNPDITDIYGVRARYSETSGEPEAVFYPYYNKGRLTGYKQRIIATKDMFCTSGPKSLYGQQLASKTTNSVLMITEGEEDAHAAKHMLVHCGPEIKMDVVSLPNGANEKGLDKVTLGQMPFIQDYNGVIICCDNDEVGEATASELAEWISTATKVKVMELDPALGKDASDYLMAGKEAEFRKAIVDARMYEAEGIVNGTDISLDDLLVAEPEGYKLPFNGLHDKLHGVRKGEIMTVCAGSGIGKTTMVREIVKCLIDQGLSVANVALEDQMKVSAQALVALDMNIPLNKFRFTPPTKSESQPSFDKMVANGKTYFFKHFGGLNSGNLMSTLYNYAKSKEVDFIVLDHISMVISATETTNERKDIDTLMTKLAAMVVETGVGLIQIVHLKRSGGDKNFAKGGEVELTDLRGSAALEQLSWAVVGMERDQQGDDRDFSNIRILKNRTFGFTGLCDNVKYNPLTGRMSTVKDEVPVLEDLTDALAALTGDTV